MYVYSLRAVAAWPSFVRQGGVSCPSDASRARESECGAFARLRAGTAPTSPSVARTISSRRGALAGQRPAWRGSRPRRDLGRVRPRRSWTARSGQGRRELRPEAIARVHVRSPGRSGDAHVLDTGFLRGCEHGPNQSAPDAGAAVLGKDVAGLDVAGPPVEVVSRGDARREREPGHADHGPLVGDRDVRKVGVVVRPGPFGGGRDEGQLIARTVTNPRFPQPANLGSAFELAIMCQPNGATRHPRYAAMLRPTSGAILSGGDWGRRSPREMALEKSRCHGRRCNSRGGHTGDAALHVKRLLARDCAELPPEVASHA